MLPNAAALKVVEESTNKVILDAMPRILQESAYISENKYKYIKPDGEELPIEMDNADAKSLAYAATKMAERLIELSNKTDGFFGPAIDNVAGKGYANAWRIMRPLMGNENARYWDQGLWAITVRAAVCVAKPDCVQMRNVSFAHLQKKVFAIPFNMASTMQQDNRFLHKVIPCSETYIQLAAELYNQLLGFATGNYTVIKE